MRYGLTRAIAWGLTFVLLAMTPMFLAYIGPVSPRSFWVELGVALGFVAVGLLVLQFLLTGRYGWVAPSFGLDSMLVFHREVGIVALIFVLAHPAVLILTDPGYLEYFDPRVNFLRALSLAGVTAATILVVASSLWRLRFRLSYEWWRLLHGGLAAFIILIAIVHPIQVGYYVSAAWKQGVFVVLGAGAFALLVNTRLVRPWRMRRRPYRVQAVSEERGDASTLLLAPEAHQGMRFVPGQFAWITLGDTPFSLQQHPYSFSSAAGAAPHRLGITIKEDGDFSTWARKVEPGLTAFLEGPYGCFVPPSDPEVGCVMIAGGVGITPCMSMLRTFADRKDSRNLVLIYANEDLDGVIFHDELAELQERLDLDVVHVLEEPPDDWDGEEGLVDEELIERHLPDARNAHDYFICGPEPMMNMAEKALLDLGVQQRRILSERFNIV
jgi:predicted ferric reductase